MPNLANASVWIKNSLKRVRFRLFLVEIRGFSSRVSQGKSVFWGCCLAPHFGQPLKTPHCGVFLRSRFSSPVKGSKTKKAVKRLPFCCLGGDKGIRTPDLYDANVSLYQLSHIPKHHCIIKHNRGDCKRFFTFPRFSLRRVLPLLRHGLTGRASWVRYFSSFAPWMGGPSSQMRRKGPAAVYPLALA